MNPKSIALTAASLAAAALLASSPSQAADGMLDINNIEISTTNRFMSLTWTPPASFMQERTEI